MGVFMNGKLENTRPLPLPITIHSSIHLLRYYLSGLDSY